MFNVIFNQFYYWRIRRRTNVIESHYNLSPGSYLLRVKRLVNDKVLSRSQISETVQRHVTRIERMRVLRGIENDFVGGTDVLSSQIVDAVNQLRDLLKEVAR